MSDCSCNCIKLSGSRKEEASDLRKRKDNRAVVLLSGGIDSTTILAIARKEGYETYGLSFRYGQKHIVEIAAARRIGEMLGLKRHLVLAIDERSFGGSALTDDIAVPKSRSVEEISKEIPVTYVPARNTIFLSYALAFAEVLNTGNIFIGVNAVDYSGYPDCRPEYIAAFERMANLAVKAAVEGKIKIRIIVPLINMTKAEIIKTGTALGIDYGLTHSCYDPVPDGRACGSCDSCLLRKKGFREAGIADPTGYA